MRGVAAEGVLALTLGGAVAAAAACGDAGLPHALIGALRPLLADPQRRLRHTAARALAAHGEEEWLAVFDEPDGPPCGAALAASALGALAMEVLVGLLTVPQPKDRKVAASTLGLRLDRGAAAALRVAARDPNAEVRAATVALLLLATCSLLLAPSYAPCHLLPSTLPPPPPLFPRGEVATTILAMHTVSIPAYTYQVRYRTRSP